jgi:hypothetical protein
MGNGAVVILSEVCLSEAHDNAVEGSLPSSLNADIAGNSHPDIELSPARSHQSKNNRNAAPRWLCRAFSSADSSANVF